MKVPFSYLKQQFAHPEPILRSVKRLVQSGDFTLGAPVQEFEEKFARVGGTRYAVGVNSGTDALFLSLKALGVGPGDEVITMPNTFIATIGAIAATGAKPVFVDCNEEYVIDVDKIEAAITPRTKALLPVHYAGHPADMPRILKIASKYGLPVVEDACQGISSTIGGKTVGSFGISGGFSLHPLKNINVWSDGGVITTNSKEMAEKLRLLRNHGMKNRDEYSIFGYNSRLDSVQAVVGLHVIKDLEKITNAKIKHAGMYDKAFSELQDAITLPPRRKNVRYVYHLYIIQARNRDNLMSALNAKGIEAKVHYPIPLHLQECCKSLGYKAGDFPVAESQAKNIITLPGHQHLTDSQIEYVIEQVRKFYER
ncbi:MAG: DegT/DnrJ/EryC1/StrS family aminotransferase [Elusimicrobia bacterium]|nr:DegT/DnrJ/EryC1/StrS family aminotransferase [Elusimicrobiota bacterium]